MTTPFQRFDSVHVEGDGAQNAVGNTVSGDLVQQSLTFVRNRPAMFLGAREVSGRMAAFVPADNHKLIVKALELDRCLVLYGPPGSGREITAMKAMRELNDELRIRRFSLEDDDTEEMGVGQGCGYLVHARDGLTRLPGAIDAIRASRSSYLAVIADDWNGNINGLPSIAIEPARALHVYQHWVTATGHGAWANWPEAPGLLEGAQALPANGRRLARLVDEAESNDASTSATERQDQVFNAYQDWSRDLQLWFHEHREPHDRALLVAAAALAPASENSVYAAAAELAKRLKVDINGAGLAWCPVTELGTLLDEQQRSSQIAFNRLGFAQSTLRHTIADYPLARQDLLGWLAALVTESLAGRQPRISLAGTFAEVAAEHGEAEIIASTVRAWGANDSPDPDFNANPAYIALSRTCLHPLVGGRVRAAMYEWSRTARLPQTLKLTLVQVCEVLGQTYPSVALTRLKHLATRGNEQIAEQVKQTTRRLVEAGYYSEALKAVLAWCALMGRETLSVSQRQKRRRVGAALFLEFAGAVNEAGLPTVLAGSARLTPAHCRPGWRAVLDYYADGGAPHSGFGVAVKRWLDAAVTHTPLRAAITDMFVSAAGGPFTSFRVDYGNSAGLTTADSAMTAVARQWFMTGPREPAQREVMEAITVPLTRSGWLRRLKRGWIFMRTKAATWRESR